MGFSSLLPWSEPAGRSGAGVGWGDFFDQVPSGDTKCQEGARARKGITEQLIRSPGPHPNNFSISSLGVRA